MYPRKINRGIRKSKCRHKARSMPQARLPAIVGRAAWERVTKRRAGIRWDSVVEKVWKDIGGNQEEMMSAEKFGRSKAEVDERVERRERLALRNEVKSEKR